MHLAQADGLDGAIPAAGRKEHLKGEARSVCEDDGEEYSASACPFLWEALGLKESHLPRELGKGGLCASVMFRRVLLL